MYLLGNHRPIEISRIAAFDDHHSGILPQPPCQLSIAHIHRGHAARIDDELLERGSKFQTSTAHEWMVRPANADCHVGSNPVRRTVHRLPGDRYQSGEDQSLRALTAVGKAAA